MIVYDLSCAEGHRFEGWFASSDDFAAQQAGGLVASTVGFATICLLCAAVFVFGWRMMEPDEAFEGQRG
ncbi:DUF1178 family protein [Leptolyngbya sp. 15MV]|nr:DUF1178 family protein [Leptolyngbya sp. 15MV]